MRFFTRTSPRTGTQRITTQNSTQHRASSYNAALHLIAPPAPHPAPLSLGGPRAPRPILPFPTRSTAPILLAAGPVLPVTIKLRDTDLIPFRHAPLSTLLPTCPPRFHTMRRTSRSAPLGMHHSVCPTRPPPPPGLLLGYTLPGTPSWPGSALLCSPFPTRHTHITFRHPTHTTCPSPSAPERTERQHGTARSLTLSCLLGRLCPH